MYRKIENILNFLTPGYGSFNGSIHREMTSEDTNQLKKATYADAVKAFNERKWNLNTTYEICLTGEDYKKDYIHANIVKFSGIGYIMNDFAYARFTKYLKCVIIAKRYNTTYNPTDWVQTLSDFFERIFSSKSKTNIVVQKLFFK